MSSVLIYVLRFYKRFMSPMLPRACRFYPSCSEYMMDAVRVKGPVRGILKGIYRIIRCNPFNPGGYDPVR